MKCRVCQTEMIERSGKYGKFLCCPNSKPGDNHGTIGIRPYLSLQDIDNILQYPQKDLLLHEVKRQSAALGYTGDDLLDWIVDEPYAAEDEPDHWMNIRPY